MSRMLAFEHKGATRTRDGCIGLRDGRTGPARGVSVTVLIPRTVCVKYWLCPKRGTGPNFIRIFYCQNVDHGTAKKTRRSQRASIKSKGIDIVVASDSHSRVSLTVSSTSVHW